eukprot:m.747683 g.747683  ORF g.747683 m.747683 type:complete len:50 (-) comp23145_c0_seq3:456-605(-)
MAALAWTTSLPVHSDRGNPGIVQVTNFSLQVLTDGKTVPNSSHLPLSAV